MNLYRLDVQTPHGSYPVVDLMGPRLIRQRSEADRAGRAVASAERCPVTLTRITGAGRLTVMGTFKPAIHPSEATFERTTR
jgi:hypothetical protein